MKSDAIKLGEQWIPCEFIPHREPVISPHSTIGMWTTQMNPADTILNIPGFMEMLHLWEGRHDVRRGSRTGVFIATAMRTNGPIGYIKYTSRA